jgi:hypothetical protein
VSPTTDKQEPLEGERGVAIAGATICFLVSSALAIFAIVVADGVPVLIRGAFLLAAGFFAWLLFFAPAECGWQ